MCYMKQNTKDWIQYTTAMLLIGSAILIAFVSLLMTMAIGPGVLAYVGEALSAGLGIFGIGFYFANKMAEFQSDIKHQVDNIKREVRHETNQ